MNMQSKSKKIVSIAIISLFLSSMLFASVPLALAKRSLTLDPNEGPSGTVVNVDGTGFDSGTHYRVYFDTNHNERYNWGEPYRTVSGPAFDTTLTVPSVASGIYYIIADVWPYTSPAIDSAKFTVTVIGAGIGPEALDPVLEAIADIEAKLDGTISSLVTTINDKLGTFDPGDTVASLLYAIEGKLDALPVWGDLVTKDLDDVISGVWSAVSRTLTGDQATALSFIGTVSELTEFSGVNTIAGALNDIKEEIKALPTWGDLVTYDLSDITDYIDSAVSTIEGDISTAVSDITTAISSAVTTLEGDISSAQSAIQSDISTLSGDVADIEAKLESGGAIYDMLSGIQSAIGTPDVDLASDIAAIEGKLDVGGDFYTFVNDWFTDIQDDISGISSDIGDLSTAVAAIETKLDNLPSSWGDLVTYDLSDITDYFGTFTGDDTVASLLYAIKAKTDTIGAGSAANTALEVQASESSAEKNTANTATIYIQVNRADNGEPVTSGATITTTFIGGSTTPTFTIGSASHVSGGTYSITVTPTGGTKWSNAVGNYYVFRIDVSVTILSATYKGSTLATITTY